MVGFPGKPEPAARRPGLFAEYFYQSGQRGGNHGRYDTAETGGWDAHTGAPQKATINFNSILLHLYSGDTTLPLFINGRAVLHRTIPILLPV